MNVSTIKSENEDAIRGMNHEIARENLSLMKSILDKHNIPFWLAWGTCLGAIRERNFIPHDTDMDIDVYGKDWYRILMLLPELKAQGFEATPVGTVGFIPGWFFGIHFERKGEQIDIYRCFKTTKKLNGSKVSGWESAYSFIEHDFFSTLETIDFLGEKYNVPRNSKEYLKYVYGSTWHITQKDFWGYWHFKSKNDLIELDIHQENLQLVKSVFENHDIPFWLAETTCWDAVMKKQALEASKGINLSAYLKDKKKVLLKALPDLKALGFECIRDSAICYTDDLIKLVIKLYRKNEVINIEFARNTKLYSRLRGTRWICGTSQFTRNYFEKLKDIDYCGDIYKIPTQARRYLSDLYGPICQQESSESLGLKEEDKQSQTITLITNTLQQEGQVEIPCRDPWIHTWEIRGNLLLERDMLTVKALDMPLSKGMIVLVRSPNLRVWRLLGYFKVYRVIEINSDGKIKLRNDFHSQPDIWYTDSDVIGQVTALHSRFGFTIPLSSKIVQRILPLATFLMRQIRRFV